MHHTHNELDKSQKTEFPKKTGTLDLKIQKKSALALIKSRKYECKCYQSKDNKKFAHESIERIKESKWKKTCRFM